MYTNNHLLTINNQQSTIHNKDAFSSFSGGRIKQFALNGGVE